MSMTDQTTVGAGKSGAQSKERFGPDQSTGWLAIFFAVGLVSPAALVLFVAIWVPAQARRVRSSRMVRVAFVASVLVALLAVVANPFGWHWDGWQSFWLAIPGIGQLVAGAAKSLHLTYMPVGYGLLGGFVLMVPVALPAALWVSTVALWWAEVRRGAIATLEGDKFDFTRPVGFMDRRRFKKNAQRIAAGGGIDRKRGTVAVGLGRFGEIVPIETDRFLSPTLVFGKNRSGKTAFARSLVAQAAVGGVIIIDFKGDDEQPEFWSQWAHHRGRKFKHFRLADKSGAPYRPPSQWAPTEQACYDPLRHGNAESKASMLQNSFPREGDAAVYHRSVMELSTIAYEVAARTGYDKGKSGFETLARLSDIEELRSTSYKVNPLTNKPYIDANTHDGKLLLARVQELSDSLKTAPLVKAAVESNRRTLSQYQNSPAAGPWLRPGDDEDHDIDLVDAIVNGDVVVFSLSVQAYPDVAKTIGMLVVNDLNNCVDTLRQLKHEGVTWDPSFVVIEEFGSAGAENIKNLANKLGDVQLRLFLSTQSWSNLVAVGGGNDTFARELISETGNVFAFQLSDNSNAKAVADLTPEVVRETLRDSKEYSSGWFRTSVRSANKGEGVTEKHTGTQLDPSVLQTLGSDDKGERVYNCIWIAVSQGSRITHTHSPYANHWAEPLVTVLVPPDAGADDYDPRGGERFSWRDVHPDNDPAAAEPQQVPAAGAWPTIDTTVIEGAVADEPWVWEPEPDYSETPDPDYPPAPDVADEPAGAHRAPTTHNGAASRQAAQAAQAAQGVQAAQAAQAAQGAQGAPLASSRPPAGSPASATAAQRAASNRPVTPAMSQRATQGPSAETAKKIAQGKKKVLAGSDRADKNPNRDANPAAANPAAATAMAGAASPTPHSAHENAAPHRNDTDTATPVGLAAGTTSAGNNTAEHTNTNSEENPTEMTTKPATKTPQKSATVRRTAPTRTAVVSGLRRPVAPVLLEQSKTNPPANPIPVDESAVKEGR